MRIRVPATSANLGPGFDTLGMALAFYNHFEAHPADVLTIQSADSTCVDTAAMSLDPAQNLFARAYSRYFEYRKTPVIPAQLIIEAHIPFSRGLGSSSSAIVAGLYLANHMHGNPFRKEALLPWAIEIEGHPDNVTPALLGGLHCCLETESILLQWPEDWGIVLVIPPTPISTEEARKLMPPHYSVSEVIQNIHGISAWVSAVLKQDTALMRYALSGDCVHEPYRGMLIPEYPIVQNLAENHQALGCIISGSGSTLAVFTPTLESRDNFKQHLKAHPHLAHCKVMSVSPDLQGVSSITPKAG